MQVLGIAACFFGSIVCIQAAPAPVISSLRPTSGTPGTLVTISGKGFTPTAGFRGSPRQESDYGGNTVRIGSGVTLKNLNSTDGLTVQFTIPRDIAPGVYGVTVVNSNGTSNNVNLTVDQLPPD